MGTKQSKNNANKDHDFNTFDPFFSERVSSGLRQCDMTVQKDDIYKYYHLSISNRKEGGTGTVVKATHRITGKTRAIKIFNREEKSDNTIENVLAEACVMENLDHPNITKIIEIYESVDCFYIVMEYADGIELFDDIKLRGKYKEEEARPIIGKILSALNYMHGEGYVHCDIKPENIMVKNQETKLIDFGCSRKLKNGQKIGKILGTAYYVAPEVIEEEFDNKADIWSLGIILYIMLTKKIPFNGKNDRGIIKNIRNGKNIFQRPEFTNLSADAQDLLKEMLNRSPYRRISAGQALEHKWFDKAISDTQEKQIAQFCLSETAVLDKQVKSLTDYLLDNTIDKETLSKIREYFTLLDIDKDGYVSSSDIQKTIRRHGNGILTKETIDNLSKLTTDPNLKLSFKDFGKRCLYGESHIQESLIHSLYNQLYNPSINKVSGDTLVNLIYKSNEEEKRLFNERLHKISFDSQKILNLEELRGLIFNLLF